MQQVEEMETAIDRLPPEDYKRIVAWFREREELRRDEQMDRDFASGKLDLLFAEADAESAADLLRKWPPRT